MNAPLPDRFIADGSVVDHVDIVNILTINLGLQAVPLPIGLQIPLAPQVDRRLRAAPAAIGTCIADIVMLQEVFTARDRNFLLAAMRRTHPYAHWEVSGTSLLGNGLLILSRWPISRGWFRAFPDKHTLLQSIWQRGIMGVELCVPRLGTLHLVNAHLSPDPPFMRPDRAPSRDYRAREIKTLLEESARTEGETIAAGDFNMGPEICPDDYRRVLRGGYADAFAAVHGEDCDAPTFDRNNALVRTGHYRQWPSQRADHVFLKAGSRLRPLNAEIVFREVLPPVEGSADCTLSDHYGVLVALTL